eukprot:TRINITY_DN14787_c0_g1_i1.p1 TRINITY_DN14787_c0_g1~~TRINITY_DN14787_c0_g1_i1.p1  ORF type:complete len:395 (+),score=88.15 TRINITY_DN14787_c0_g1_i1:34-1185(+)
MRTVGSPDLTVRGMSPDRNPSLTDGTAVRTTRARLLAMYTQTIKESPWLTSPSPERLRNTSVRLGNDAEGQGRWRDWNSMRKDGVTISTTEYRELLEAHRDLVFLRKGKGRSVHRVRGRSVHTDGASVHADTEPLSPAAHHSSIILQTESNALTTTVPVNEWFSGSVRVEEDVLLITTATDPHKRLSFFLNATKLSPLTTNDGIGIKGGGKVCYLRFEACDVAAAFLEDIEAYIHHSIQRARGQREVYEESVRSHRSPSYERYQHMAPLDRHERSVMEPRQSVTPILPCHPHNSFDRYEKYHPVDEEKVIASLRSASPDKKVRIQEHTSRRRRRRRSRSTSEPRTRRGSSKAASSSSHHRRRRRHSTTPSAQPYQPEYLARSP